ncbi:MAG: hypothetical protein NVSMB46_02670 [Candidatus Saccharimonadales bacterium]
MYILTFRTDNPDAQICLFDGSTMLFTKNWTGHRRLAEIIHIVIKEVLDSRHISYQELGGIVCFQGPGSFTGLRIGLTVANAIAQSYSLPIVATQGDEWKTDGIALLLSGKNHHSAQPFYGAEVHITLPKN